MLRKGAYRTEKTPKAELWKKQKYNQKKKKNPKGSYIQLSNRFIGDVLIKKYIHRQEKHSNHSLVRLQLYCDLLRNI